MLLKIKELDIYNFFENCSLSDEYVGLIYYINGYDGIMLKLSFLEVNGKKDNGECTDLSHPYYSLLTEVNFDTFILLNDFVKMNPDRFLLASTAHDFQKLYIYLIYPYD